MYCLPSVTGSDKRQDGGKRILNEQPAGKDEGGFSKEWKGHDGLFLT